MPKKPSSTISFTKVLADLIRWWKKTGVDGLIIGGVAASLLGRPRMTQDIDALIMLDASLWDSFVRAGRPLGFRPRRADALDFARRNRVLLMQHISSGIGIDISLGALPFERESLKRAVRVRIEKGLIIPIPSPEDLIVMKAVAHRPKDMIDIESIVEATPRLDTRRIKAVVKEFASALEMPDVYDDLVKILARGKKKHR